MKEVVKYEDLLRRVNEKKDKLDRKYTKKVHDVIVGHVDGKYRSWKKTTYKGESRKYKVRSREIGRVLLSMKRITEADRPSTRKKRTSNL